MEGTESLIRGSDVQNPTPKDILLAYIAPGVLLARGIYRESSKSSFSNALRADYH
jgi:hypothetical protein